jgi:hypothetical protein
MREMRQEELFTDNLIELMRQVFAAEELSSNQKTRIYERVRRRLEMPSEEEQLRLWPLEAYETEALAEADYNYQPMLPIVSV